MRRDRRDSDRERGGGHGGHGGGGRHRPQEEFREATAGQCFPYPELAIVHLWIKQ